jgi:hypothetical protein
VSARGARLVLLGLLLAIASPPGCVKDSDRHQTEAQTWSNLVTWSECIKSTHDAGIDLAKKTSAKEAADYLKNIGAVSGLEYSQLASDAWGRPYHWQVSVHDATKIIKITSDGKDGISQDGGGDDLFIEVDIPRQGPITIRQNRPKHSAFD